MATFGLLVGSLAMTGCGDDEGTGGNGGAGGGATSSSSRSSSSSSSTSTSTGSGGEGGEGGAGVGGEGGVGGVGGEGGEGGVGGDNGEGGAGGAPDIGPGPDESCSGCARLAVPLTEASTGTLFQFNWPELVDLTGATVTFRVKAHAGTGGGVQTYVQNGGAQNWVGVPWAWTDLSSLGEWTELTIDVDAAAADAPTFDKTQVMRLGLKIDAGTAGPWANPTVVYIDSITVTRPASAGGAGGEGGEGGEGGVGGASVTSGAGGAGGEGGASVTSGTGGEGGASVTSGTGGEGGAGGTSGEGGAGGTSGEGGAGGTSGEGGAGGTSGEGGAGGTSGEGGAGGTSGEGGAGGGASGDVDHVAGPFEFTTDLQGFGVGDYLTVQGSRLDFLGE
ncbi:hypothetical protein [Sorangium sp. So ce1151]|uniref:hypothetical protein n=1 Tax=Sorangium sp. So ce1151 TaxID=3133332 RepID=UPI003F628E71